MRQLIWGVYIIGLFVAIHFWGTSGRVFFCAGVFLVITLFRRRLVLALTRLSSKLGLIGATIDRMPAAIHLSRAAGPTEAATPILTALAACKFVDAGAKAEILKHSPSGKVPCLIDGETLVWDSLAICEYLAEKSPTLWPATRSGG